MLRAMRVCRERKRCFSFLSRQQRGRIRSTLLGEGSCKEGIGSIICRYPFPVLQALTVLKIKPEVEEACLEESCSAEQQGRALVESSVKEEPGETEGCDAALLCC